MSSMKPGALEAMKSTTFHAILLLAAIHRANFAFEFDQTVGPALHSRRRKFRSAANAFSSVALIGHTAVKVLLTCAKELR